MFGRKKNLEILEISEEQKKFLDEKKQMINEENKSLNNISKEVNSNYKIIENIYFRVNRNKFIGPIDIRDYNVFLNWWEGKKAAWFLISLEMKKNHNNFVIMNNEELKIKKKIEVIQKQIWYIDTCNSNIEKILEKSGQMK